MNDDKYLPVSNSHPPLGRLFQRQLRFARDKDMDIKISSNNNNKGGGPNPPQGGIRIWIRIKDFNIIMLKF